MDEKDDGGGRSPNEKNTKVALLEAACQAAGGLSALAARLEISEAMLRKYASGAFPMPDALFLRAVDVLLAERERLFEALQPGKPVPDDRADA